MAMKLTNAILTVLMFMVVAQNARAEIASKEYVDERNNLLIFGEADPNSERVEDIIEEGGMLERVFSIEDDLANYASVDRVESAINAAMEDKLDALTGGADAARGIVYAEENATTPVQSVHSGYIGDGGIAWKSINLPTPPAACAGTGGSCVLMFVGNNNPAQQKIVWEIVQRAPGDTPPTTGAVGTGQYNTNTIGSVFSDD